MISFYTKCWDDLSKEELYEILKLRIDVFCVEQQRILPDLDSKDRDPRVLHTFGKNQNNAVVCYARTVPAALSNTKLPPTASVGRVAVLKNYRGQNLGQRLFQETLHAIEVHYGSQCPVSLYAQQYLEKFYGSFGFKAVGLPFEDGGISHIIMTRP